MAIEKLLKLSLSRIVREVLDLTVSYLRQHLVLLLLSHELCSFCMKCCVSSFAFPALLEVY